MKHRIIKSSMLAFIAILSSCSTTKFQEIGFGGGENTSSNKCCNATEKVSTTNKKTQIESAATEVLDAGSTVREFDEPKTISDIGNQTKLTQVHEFKVDRNSQILKKANSKQRSKFGFKEIKRSLKKTSSIDSELVRGFFTVFSIITLISALMFIGALFILLSGQWETALLLGAIGYYGLIIAMIVGIITLILWLISLS